MLTCENRKLKKLALVLKLTELLKLRNKPFIYNILTSPSSSFWLHNVKRETRGEAGEISGKDVQFASDTCSFWSLYRQFFNNNKKSRKWNWGRCHEIVITDGLYLRSKNTFSINICKRIGYFYTGSAPEERSNLLFKINTV